MAHNSTMVWYYCTYPTHLCLVDSWRSTVKNTFCNTLTLSYPITLEHLTCLYCTIKDQWNRYPWIPRIGFFSDSMIPQQRSNQTAPPPPLVATLGAKIRNRRSSLKVPKRENFLLAFFALSGPIWVGDLGTKKKKKFFSIWPLITIVFGFLPHTECAVNQKKKFC
jgi:hypothetical protein